MSPGGGERLDENKNAGDLRSCRHEREESPEVCLAKRGLFQAGGRSKSAFKPSCVLKKLKFNGLLFAFEINRGAKRCWTPNAGAY